MNETLAFSDERFEPLLQHREFVRRLAANLLRDPADVDDVEQETWLAALRSQGQALLDPRAWLATVTRNNARMRLRSQRRQVLRDGAAARRESVDGGQRAVEETEVAQRLISHVLALEEPNRSAVLVRCRRGGSLAAVAKELGVTPTVAKGRLQRGLEELRLRLDRDPETDRPSWTRGLAALALPTANHSLPLGVAAAVLLLVPVMIWRPWQADLVRPRPLVDDLPARAGAQVEALAASAGTTRETGDAGAASASVAARSTSGVVELRTGQGFVFGEESARPDGDRSGFDLVVYDVPRGRGVILGTLNGGGTARRLFSSVGLPESPVRAFELLDDAPEQLDASELQLTRRVTVEHIGLGFARGLDGEVYKLCVESIDDHVEVLQRRFLLRYERVPTRPDGGRLRLPLADDALPADVVASLERSRALASKRPLRVPAANPFDGDFVAVQRLLPDVRIDRDEHVVVEEVVDFELLTGIGAGLLLRSGVAAGGAVRCPNGLGLVATSPVDGEVRSGANSFLHLAAGLSGVVRIDGPTAIVVDGPFSGVVSARSTTRLLVRGAFSGRIEASSFVDLYLPGIWTRDQLSELKKQIAGERIVTIHLESSDLEPGRHAAMLGFNAVLVGEELWVGLGR